MFYSDGPGSSGFEVSGIITTNYAAASIGVGKRVNGVGIVLLLESFVLFEQGLLLSLVGFELVPDLIKVGLVLVDDLLSERDSLRDGRDGLLQ